MFASLYVYIDISGQMDNESGSQLAMETERAGREAAQHDAKQLRLQLQELKADNTVLLENVSTDYFP